jgi:uncharacterized protein
MLDDAASQMKERLRTDLRAAMKDRNVLRSRVIRSLVAAIDNAEAPALPLDRKTPVQHQFEIRSAEVERLRLDWPAVRAIVRAEFQERERAAAEFDRLEIHDRAAELRTEAGVIEHYLA